MNKGGPGPNVANIARKRVRVESVVSLDSQKDAAQRGAAFPGLVSFAEGMAPSSMDDLTMRLVKRRRANSHEEADLNNVTPELIAQKAEFEWLARKNFTEMNHDYFIGVRNRKTDTIQLFEIDGMYSLRPFVRRKQIAGDEPTADPSEKERTYAEQKRELLETFGGKRSIKKVEKYEKDRITDDKLNENAHLQVNEAARAMMEKDATEGIHHLQRNTTESMAPPHDDNATTPEDAYPLEGLITPGELAALEQEVWSMTESCSESTASLENPGWNPLVWDSLIQTAKNKGLPNSTQVRRMQAAMHLHYLIALSGCTKNIGSATQAKLMEEMAVDDGVLKCLLERFTVANQARTGKPTLRRKTKAGSARLVVYAIIMWITASGFKNCGRLNDLADALGVSIKLVLTYALQVGCKVKKKQESEGSQVDYRLSLKVPLTFPEIRRRQGRPQKRS